MKKLLLIFNMLVLTLTTFSQYDVSLGVTGFIIDTKLSSHVGINMGISINHFYCDLSNNFAIGNGKYLGFSPSNVYNADKMSVGIINIGYDIYIFSSHTWSVIPIIGYGCAREIYEEPNGWRKSYNTRSYINFGIIAKVHIKKVGIFIGREILEFKFGLSYKFN